MTNIKNTYSKLFLLIALAGTSLLFNRCSKNLDYQSFNQLSGNEFFKTASDAQSAVTAMYAGLMGGPNEWQGGWGAASQSWKVQDEFTSGTFNCNWGGDWANYNSLNFTPDNGNLASIYLNLMPMVSQITVGIDKIGTINMDATLKARYIGELKALRAMYSYLLYDYYGPVPIRLDPALAADPKAEAIARPTNDWMVSQIEKDFNEAIAVLPPTFSGPDYGRISGAACYMGLMKLYMHEKNWSKAVIAGKAIQSMGFSLVSDYASNFSYSNKAGNSEIILAIPCTPTAWPNTNMWLPHVLPTDYMDTTGIPLTEWGGYRMPWKLYNEFDPSDKRLNVLLRNYHTASGVVDAKTRGDIGAVPMKYGPDPTKQNSQNSGVNFVVYRYADVELLMAEAINEINGGPNPEAYGYIRDVRARAGLGGVPIPDGLNHDQFLARIQNERLFELWGEGVRRDDLIRWGLYIKRAVDDGFGSTAQPTKVLYPIPRQVISQSNGVVQQNPGYN